MRLKSITLAGFKSFVDRTRVDFPSEITAIVGPNGCGKSNIIDAVRCLMGESSARYLRGESMSDVIFNGSVHRAPSGQASIELHFDNTLGRLGGEYAGFNEIQIRRQVTREGQSNYYLNGTRCRRKDVTNIFLGTGLGPRSYAIIEQGTISRLIEAKPEELRIFLEEAAGISRYKERRKETQQRIEHTRDNLTRVNDVREELGKHVAHLERQAKLAEKYKEYKAEERMLRAQLFVSRHQQLQVELMKNKTESDQIQIDIEQQEAHYKDLTDQLQQQFDIQQQTQKKLEQYQQHYADLNTAHHVCVQKIQHNNTQQQQFETELKQLTQQKNEASHLNILDDSSIEQLAQSLASVEQELQQLNAQLIERQQQHQQAALQQKNWVVQWQEINLHLANSSQTAQVEQTRMQQIEQRLQQLTQQQQKLNEEQTQLTTQEDETKCVDLQQQLNQLNELRTHHQQTLVERELQLTQQREQQQQLTKSLNESLRELQQFEGKLTALNTLQHQALGRQEQNVQAWLNKHQLHHTERLANAIEVDAQFERHLEYYLGEKLQAIALSNFDQLNEWLGDFSKGCINFIETSAATQGLNQTDDLVLLASKVRGPQALLRQLEHVYCAANLSEALSAIATLPKQAEIITPDGFLVQHQWVQVRRGKDEEAGVLQRKREIKQIEVALSQAKETIQLKEQQQKFLLEALDQLEIQKQLVQKQCQEVEQQKHQLNAQLHVQQSQIQQKLQRRQKLTEELEAAGGEFQTIEAQHSTSRQLWQEALNQLTLFNETKDQLIATQSEVETQQSQTSRALRETQEALQQQQMKQQKCATEHQGLVAQKQRTAQQLEYLTQRQKNLLDYLEQLKPVLIECESQLLNLQNQRQQAEIELEQEKVVMDQGANTLRRIEAERQILAESLEKTRQNFSNNQIHAEHAQTKSSGLLEQFAELDLVFEEIAANLPQQFCEEESQVLLDQIQNRISRLGAINLAAIGELTEQIERKQFIDKQYDDLTEALATLDAAIREIDQETKAKFQTTFDTVNNNFQQLFPKIFGGGQAYLSLTSDDLLETGVIVFAQPPGKRNSTIHLLSGGEKALTALALVFAIFELNPAPFCMLDEVDAPLDDANVGRFCNLVKAMAKKTQFIVVTHNKVAMEMAHHLMGVTMQEPGVSRLVAVDVEAAIAMTGQ